MREGISAEFVCETCSHQHFSQHTVLDTFCPRCGETRERQHLLVCDECAMPVAYEASTFNEWFHCTENPTGCQQMSPSPVPVPGLRMWVIGFGRYVVTRVTENRLYLRSPESGDETFATRRSGGGFWLRGLPVDVDTFKGRVTTE